MRLGIERGWGAAPVGASGVDRQGGVETGLPGPFVAWVRGEWLTRCPRALLACTCPLGNTCPALRGRYRLAGGGRAKRGLDLFLGQNRTKRGDGDA